MADLQILFTIAGIGLEIVGFILTFRAIKGIEFLRRIELGYVEKVKVRMPTGIEHSRLHIFGILLVIAGLG